MAAAGPENLTAKPPAEEIDGGTGHSSTSVPGSATRDLETATARKRQDWHIRSLGRNGYKKGGRPMKQLDNGTRCGSVVWAIITGIVSVAVWLW